MPRSLELRLDEARAHQGGLATAAVVTTAQRADMEENGGKGDSGQMGCCKGAQEMRQEVAMLTARAIELWRGGGHELGRRNNCARRQQSGREKKRTAALQA